MLNLFRPVVKAHTAELQQRLNETTSRANDLDARLQEAQNKVLALENQIKVMTAEEANASFAVDFKTINAFSVERNVHDGRPCTIIGYLLPKETVKDGGITNTDVVREWYLYCSINKHESLVQEFRESRK